MADQPYGSGKRTTIYDLAVLAGTSPSAVSSVLNGTWRKRRISASLAEKIMRIAEEQAYSINMQASVLRRSRSRLIGMIVPKYDNRYFGSIVERFEIMARDNGLFPIITCTRRDPALEVQAARAMISHKVDCLIATGATNPDLITELCMSSGVRSLNLDLPGSLAPSVISDNFGGALSLTRRILADCTRQTGTPEPAVFIGGRLTDQNTSERLRGFRQAHAEAGIAVDEDMVLAKGYASDKAEAALKACFDARPHRPRAFFVNSTITLEGVLRAVRETPCYRDARPVLGCFDWDPLVALLDNGIAMVRQDVDTMLREVFKLMDPESDDPRTIVVPTLPAFDETG